MSSPQEREAAMIALGDQVQQACAASGLNIAWFIVRTVDGGVEYRSPFSLDVVKADVYKAADAL